MAKIRYVLVLPLLLLIAPLALASVQIDSSDIFRITNADINFSSTQTFDNLDVAGTYIDFAGGSFFIVPTTPINVTIVAWNTSGNYYKQIGVSSNTHNNPTVYRIPRFPVNKYIQVNTNGVFSNYYLSDGSGYITFTHSTYSDLTIEAFLVPSSIEVTTCPGVNSDINAAFGLIGVLLIVFAAGMLISGIRSMNYPFMIVGIGAAITGAIMIIVGYFITVTISNGVGCLG